MNIIIFFIKTLFSITLIFLRKRYGIFIFIQLFGFISGEFQIDTVYFNLLSVTFVKIYWVSMSGLFGSSFIFHLLYAQLHFFGESLYLSIMQLLLDLARKISHAT